MSPLTPAPDKCSTGRETASAPDGPTLADVRTWPATVDMRRACTALGISGSWGYQLQAEGAFPCRTLQIRGRTKVLTSSLISLLETGQA